MEIDLMMRDASDILEQAETLFRDNRLGAAIDLLQRGMKEEPDNLLLQVRLADYLRRHGDANEAISLYRNCALEYADRGALPFAVALYKVLVPLSQSSQQDREGARSLLRELVQRYQKYQAKVAAEGAATSQVASEPPEIPLFADMSREALEEVISGVVRIRIRAGQVLFKEGDEGASIFIVIKGYVRVSSGSNEGERIELARLGPGDFFGEWSVITGDYRRHAWVEAETDVELLELPKEMLDEITERYPRVRQIINAYYRRRKLDTLLANVFPSLLAVDRRKLAERLRKEERYPRGKIIFREGDTSEYMSIIEQGTVEIYTYNLDGVKIPLALLGPGQYFGEGGALSGKPRTATVRARTDVVLHHVSREDLVTSLISYPEILSSLQGVRVERIGATLEKLEGDDNLRMDISSEETGEGLEEDSA